MSKTANGFSRTAPIIPTAPAPAIVEEYPLSYGQRALWFVQRLMPQSAAYNVAHGAVITSPLDMVLFRQAFQQLVERHPALRTTFTVVNGEPVQQVHAAIESDFQVEDIAAWSEEKLQQRLDQEIYRPFDLEQGPLMRVRIFSRSPHHHLVLLIQHHTITDLWSLALIIHEWSQLYNAQIQGRPAKLKPIRGAYREFVADQLALLESPEGERLWQYWRKQLAGDLPVLELPTDRPRPPIPNHRGGAELLRLDPELTQQLKRLAKSQGATLFSTMLAAFQVLLHRYTGQEDILVGSPRANRSRKLSRTLGYFVNPVVLRGDLSGNPSFREYLKRNHATVTDAFAHGDFPFPLLVERLQPGRDPSRSPLFQVAFAWQKTTRIIDPAHMTSLALGAEGNPELTLEELTLQPIALAQRPTAFDLTLLIAEAGEGLAASIEYSADLFTSQTVRRMLGHYETLLKGIVADPDQPIGQLPLLTPAERRRILVEWNDTAAPFPEKSCAHELIAQWAEKNPDGVAVRMEGGDQLTYQELERRANQLAHHLRKLGVKKETLVGLMVERSLEMVVGMLGILKAGGAYVPLDPAYPPERLAFMLQDAKVPLLLTQESLTGQLPTANLQSPLSVIRLDADWPAIAQEPASPPEVSVSPDDLAYVIYTSGSTGRPKGVLLRHRGLSNLCTLYTPFFYIGPGRRILQFFSFSFDGSVWEIFSTLANGATLQLVKRETLASIPDLVRLIQMERVDTVTMTPSMLSMLPEEELPGLHRVIVGGEACPASLVKRWAPGRIFINAYGPTEATVLASFYRGRAEEEEAPPIGKPLANIQLYILDRYRQPVPVGVPGELYIGGVGLAKGYLNRPELTAERFVPVEELEFIGQEVKSEGVRSKELGVGATPDPLLMTPSSSRLYRTGDLCRFRPDGNIEFLGRVDHQVKVRGFRIELGEIEATLCQHPDVREAAVIVREDMPGGKRLVAYYVPTDGAAEDGDPTLHVSRSTDEATEAGPEANLSPHSSLIPDLRAFLADRLPDYMIPTHFVPLDALPVTPNGKVDRQALPRPTSYRPVTNGGKPRNEMERIIAQIWQEALGLEQVGIHDNFFDLGGHSLLMARIHAELRAKIAPDLPMVELFRHPTVSALAQHLSQTPSSQRLLQQSQERAGRQKRAMAQRRRRMQAVARGRNPGGRI